MEGLGQQHPNARELAILDEHSQLLEVTAEAWNAQSELNTNDGNLSEVLDQCRAEVAEVKRKWQNHLYDLRETRDQSQQTVHDLRNRMVRETAEGYSAGSISDEDMLYVSGLAADWVDGRIGFDFDRASDYVELYRSMQPDAKVLMFSFSGHPGLGISDVGFTEAGVLAEQPKLSFKDGSYLEKLWPVINFNFKDQSQVTIEWGRRIAVGDEQVEEIVAAWFNDHGQADFYMHSSPAQARHIIEDLANLAPLELDIPEKDRLQAKALDVLKDSINEDDPIRLSYLMDYLPSVYVLDKTAYDSIVDQLIRLPGFNQWSQLEAAVAISPIGYRAWQALDESAQRLAVATAAKDIAEKRIDNAEPV